MKKLISLCLFLTMTAFLFGQDKYGHLNFGNMISAMPETEIADSSLEAYQTELVAAGEKMAEAFQVEYVAFVNAANEGSLTPVQQQQQEAALQTKQQEILAYEQEIVGLLGQRRGELLQPIIEQAQAVINEVAKENGFAMVFDTSISGAILFSTETEDLWDLVAAKLGLE